MGRSTITLATSCSFITRQGHGQAQHVCDYSLGQQRWIRAEDGSARALSIRENRLFPLGAGGPLSYRRSILLTNFCVKQMPFADDVRKYTFSPLLNVSNRKGERVMTHPYLPTHEQMEVMDCFVDAMDLMQAEKDDDG